MVEQIDAPTNGQFGLVELPSTQEEAKLETASTSVTPVTNAAKEVPVTPKVHLDPDLEAMAKIQEFDGNKSELWAMMLIGAQELLRRGTLKGEFHIDDGKIHIDVKGVEMPRGLYQLGCRIAAKTGVNHQPTGPQAEPRRPGPGKPDNSFRTEASKAIEDAVQALEFFRQHNSSGDFSKTGDLIKEARQEYRRNLTVESGGGTPDFSAVVPIAKGAKHQAGLDAFDAIANEVRQWAEAVHGKVPAGTEDQIERWRKQGDDGRNELLDLRSNLRRDAAALGVVVETSRGSQKSRDTSSSQGNRGASNRDHSERNNTGGNKRPGNSAGGQEGHRDHGLDPKVFRHPNR